MNDKQLTDHVLLKMLSQIIEDSRNFSDIHYTLKGEYDLVKNKTDFESRLRKNELLMEVNSRATLMLSNEIIELFSKLWRIIENMSKGVQVTDKEIQDTKKKVEETLLPLKQIIDGEKEIRGRENNIYN